MTTPVCPKCGSIRVRLLKNVARCQEDDCSHFAVRRTFLAGGPEIGSRPVLNQHWREGAALSMDGIQS